jgi:hypothetical protein
MIEPSTITPTALPSVTLDERRALPTQAGIYFVLAADTVLYIGQAGSLAQRWVAHHRLRQFNEYGNCRIAWLYVDDAGLLDQLEDACKKHFQPVLNGKRVPGGTRLVRAGQTWIEVRVSRENRDRLNQWAADLGLSASLIMRLLLEEALAEGRADRLEVPGPRSARPRRRVEQETGNERGRRP